MIIEIHKPELETLIQQRMANGTLPDIEDVLLTALEATTSSKASVAPKTGADLVAICAMVSGLTDDLDFSRNPSVGRLLDLA